MGIGKEESFGCWGIGKAIGGVYKSSCWGWVNLSAVQKKSQLVGGKMMADQIPKTASLSNSNLVHMKNLLIDVYLTGLLPGFDFDSFHMASTCP